jgi:hypothetical protein
VVLDKLPIQFGHCGPFGIDYNQMFSSLLPENNQVWNPQTDIIYFAGKSSKLNDRHWYVDNDNGDAIFTGPIYNENNIELWSRQGETGPAI